MKKTLLLFFVLFSSFTNLRSQCVYTCQNYALSPTAFTTFPAAGATAALGDDDLSTAIPIGFTFNFFCTNFTQVRICSNGFITFDIFSPITLSTTPYAQGLPSFSAPNDVIAYNWNDLDPSAGGSITYTTLGVSPNRMFIVSYNSVPLWNFPNLLNSGQIVLYETSQIIEIHTGNATNNGWLTATEGIENGAATIGVTVPGRNLQLWTASNSSYRWSPYQITAPTSILGNTFVCQGEAQTYSTNTLPGNPTYQWFFPPGWTGTGLSSAINATTGSSGNVLVTANYTCGTSQAATLAVVVNPAPVVMITATPNVICSGNTVSINGSGALNYTLLPGGQNGSPPFTDTPPTGTIIYQLKGVDGIGCKSINTATAAVLVRPSPTVSVNSGSTCPGELFNIVATGADSYDYSSVFPTFSSTLVGVYTVSVTGTNTNGCVSSVVLSTIAVTPLPNVTAVANRTAMCLKETLTLTANGASTYTWTNTLDVTNSITVSPLATGVFTVTGTSALGCKNTATLNIKVSFCTGVEDMSALTNSLKVFPNPSSGVFTIKNSFPCKIIIYDSAGRLVFDRAAAESPAVCDLRHLAPGAYLVRCVGTNNEEHSVLIIQ